MIDRIKQLEMDMKDWHMDGFYCFEQKKKLFRILWAAEQALKDAPYFAGEEELMKQNEPTRD